MKEIFDDKNELKLLIYGKEDLFNQETSSNYNTYSQQLNMWSKDNNIQNYICKDMLLGDFLSIICRHSTSCRSTLIHKHILALNNDKLVGTALVTINDDPFKEHISNNTQYDNIKNDENPLFFIEYLATNPDFRNLGFATRLVSSIKKHKNLISDSSKTCGISAVIHNDNAGSKKAFLKNHFICTPVKSFTGIDKDFRVYYFGKHKKIFTKDI